MQTLYQKKLNKNAKRYKNIYLFPLKACCLNINEYSLCSPPVHTLTMTLR